MKQNNKTHILFRYGIITLAFLVFAIGVVVKLIETTVVNAPAWNERAHRELSQVTVIPPERGNILASNGNILACNLKVYDIKLDLRHNKVMKQNVIPWAKSTVSPTPSTIITHAYAISRNIPTPQRNTPGTPA